MSNFYLDILKDRLYTFKANSVERRSCQTALYEILTVIVHTIAPILVFTAEEIWQNMPRTKDLPESVHLSLWPYDKILSIDKDLEDRWHRISNFRDVVLKALEEKRSSGIIGSSLEAKVAIYAGTDEEYNFLKRYENNLPEILIVSQVEVGRQLPPQEAVTDQRYKDVSIAISKADGVKCVRCWNYSLSVDDNQICKKCQKAL
jgi:isoleucyl-tRNA synthetase